MTEHRTSRSTGRTMSRHPLDLLSLGTGLVFLLTGTYALGRASGVTVLTPTLLLAVVVLTAGVATLTRVVPGRQLRPGEPAPAPPIPTPEAVRREDAEWLGIPLSEVEQEIMAAAIADEDSAAANPAAVDSGGLSAEADHGHGEQGEDDA